MTTDPYGDRDLAALYDADNPGGIDHDFYSAMADAWDARRIVDLGCGTGLLTRRLATTGRSVTGIDPSRTMLDWARRQPGAHDITWIEGDATSIPPTRGHRPRTVYRQRNHAPRLERTHHRPSMQP